MGEQVLTTGMIDYWPNQLQYLHASWFTKRTVDLRWREEEGRKTEGKREEGRHANLRKGKYGQKGGGKKNYEREQE